MENFKAFSPQKLAECAKMHESNAALKVARNALYKNKIDDVACVMPRGKAELFNFSICVDTLPAANQKQSGRCWLFAGLNLLREQVALRCGLDEFEFSQNYLAFWDKFEKCNWYLEGVISLRDKNTDDRVLTWLMQNSMVDGGQWDMFVSLVEKYGVVPQSAMPETANSSATLRINKLLKTRLGIAAAAIFEAAKKGADMNALEEIKNSALADIYNMLCCSFGTPPVEFDFEYTDREKTCHVEKKLDPLKFYQNYTAANLTDYVSIIHAPTPSKPYYATYTVDYLGNVAQGRPILYLNLPVEEMKDLVMHSLKMGEGVWFGSDVGNYGDREGGVWDIDLFDYDTLFNTSFEMTKANSLDYRVSAMGHAMLITGVNLEDNLPTKWKIENSWGDKSGNKGYYVMSDKWFSQYVYQAVVKKSSLNARQREALKTPPTHLPPWDAMGSLA